jgi:hypothetical protein
MKLRLLICLTVVVGGVSLALWPGATPAVADHQLVTAATALAPVVLGSGPEYSYVGSKACKKCHLAVYKSWSKNKLAKALETLKPGQAAEAKKKHGLDPEKDYTKDETCLKCHSTGFGEKGGYAVPDPADKKAVKKAKNLEGVGCESCHGPGSEYSKLFKEIQKSKRTYTLEEVQAAGLSKMGPEVCTKCHNDQGPTFNKDEPFDFEKQKAKELHEHKELKQREK